MSYIPEASLPVDWRYLAECRTPGIAADFFPHQAPGKSNRDVWAHAREVCASCRVTSECLILALDNDEREGMWGGLTPDERSAVKARQR